MTENRDRPAAAANARVESTASPDVGPAAAEVGPGAEPAEGGRPDRLRRPELERTAPIRTLAGGAYDPRYGQGRTGRFEDASRRQEAADREPSPAKGRRAPAGTAERCVEAGYDIADENVRNARSFGSFSGAGSTRDFLGLSGQVMSAASDLGQLWFQLLESVLGNMADFGAASWGAGMKPSALGFPDLGFPSPGFPDLGFLNRGRAAQNWGSPDWGSAGSAAAFPGMADLGAASAAGGYAGGAQGVDPWLADRLAVRVKIKSQQGAELAVELHPGRRDRPIQAGALTAVEAGVAPIEGLVVSTTEDGELRCDLEVPPDQATGLYHGVLFDPSDGRPSGTVFLRLG